MKDRIEEAISTSTADYTEIRLHERESTVVRFRGRVLETANASVDVGGMVRCLNRAGGWGLGTFNDTRHLADKVAKAATSASLVGRGDPVELAEIPASRQDISVALDRDFRGVSLADKKRLLEEYNEVLLGSDRHIVDSTAAYGDSFERVTFASSEGTLVSEARPMITVYLVAVAREGDNVQTARESISGQRGYDFLYWGGRTWRCRPVRGLWRC